MPHPFCFKTRIVIRPFFHAVDSDSFGFAAAVGKRKDRFQTVCAVRQTAFGINNSYVVPVIGFCPVRAVDIVPYPEPIAVLFQSLFNGYAYCAGTAHSSASGTFIIARAIAASFCYSKIAVSR